MKSKLTENEKTLRNTSNGWSYNEKMAALKVMDEMNNVGEAAKELGLHRTTLFKWKRLYWEDYLAQKEQVDNNMATVQAKKMALFGGTERLTDKSCKLFETAIDFFLQDDNFEKLGGKDKVQLINVILPYVLERRVVSGVKGNTPKQQNNFFQNIFNQAMNNGNSNNQNSDNGNIPTFTISE